MKKIIYYFDPKVHGILQETVSEDGEKKVVLSSPYNFVGASEIVARIINIEFDDQIPTRLDPGYEYYHVFDFQSIKADTGIYYDETTGAYKASAFGFVIMDGQRIRWLSPVSITKDRLRAYFSVYPTKFGKLPTVADIDEALHKYKIISRIEQAKVKEQLDAISPSTPRFARILVAQGREPVNGHEEYYLPLINIKKKAGEIKEDGSIDFKEVGSIIEVKKDQDVLRRIPAVKPADGYDVYGDKSFAEFEGSKGYSKGENIVQSIGDENIFVSAIDGCLDISSNKLSVLPIAYIQGDVNYDTGNIDFNGSVHIMGSVLPGFSVKANGDIIIEKNVDDAYIESAGSITVKMGVVGRENVKLVAGGTVVAKYLLNAKVEAAGDIVVEDSIINCDVFANSMISVVAKQGKIIGGRTTALYEIQVNVSGSPNETETQLNVGRNLYIERELQEINKEISKWRKAVDETVSKLKLSFGESVFDNPKEFIDRLPSVKKKNCLLLLKELSSENKELKKYVAQNKEEQEKLKLEREPYIIIKNKAYPGTIISIRKSIKRIDTPIDNVKYYEDPEDKIIRFSPAV
jgi:uncharacterized protein (DUF342 family)